MPLLSTIDNLSPSGSHAKPISAFSSITFLLNIFRFSAIGSGFLSKTPELLQKISTTSQFNFLSIVGRILKFAPFTVSITTLKFLSFILLISIKSRSNKDSINSEIASRLSKIFPV